jgi:hypothetical protein
MEKLLGDKVIPQILDAGFNPDLIDGDAIDSLGIHYPVLVLPGIKRLPVSTFQKIEQYALQGGIVIATRSLPSTAPGLVNADSDSKQIQEISQRLFRDKSAPGHFLDDENQLGAFVAGKLKPDVVFAPKTPEIGFNHRQLSAGDLYFIANTSNQPHRVAASFRSSGRYAAWWDAFTGRISRIESPAKIEISLQPYESRLIYLTDLPSTARPERPRSENAHSSVIDLSGDWNLRFNGMNQITHTAARHSWSEEESFKYYSGQVAYEKAIDLPANVSAANSLVLDFGEGKPVAKPDPLPAFNLRAYLEGPVREAAEVYVNGQRAGVVWHPPYTIDVTTMLKTGRNELRIVVGNTAINSLASRALPDYRLLNDRYSERFIPQGMDNLQPLPSGLLGGLRLKINNVTP